MANAAPLAVFSQPRPAGKAGSAAYGTMPMPDDTPDAMQILAGALPFLKRYDDQIVVVKYGGHAMG